MLGGKVASSFYHPPTSPFICFILHCSLTLYFITLYVKYYKLFYIIVFALISWNLEAQTILDWAERYNGTGSSFDVPAKMILQADGNIVIAGSTIGIGTLSDISVIKYSNSGSELWARSFNGPDNSTDNARSLAVDNSGNIYVTGFVTSSGEPKLTLIKYNSTGDLQWSRQFDTTGVTISFGEAVTIAPDGFIYVSGFTRNASNNFDILTLKYDTNGNILWGRSFNGLGNGDDMPVNVLCEDSNNIYIAGTGKNSNGSIDVILLKYNSTGEIRFSKYYNGSSSDEDRATSAALDASGNVIISGVSITPQNGFDYLTLKYDSSGTLKWDETYNGTGNSIDYTYQVITDTLDNIYVTGSSRSGPLLGTEDAVTIKYNTFGVEQWVNRFDGKANGSDIGYCLAVDKFNNVYVGVAIDKGNIKLQIGVVKINPSGSTLWDISYVYSPAPEDFPYSIAVDSSRNIYVCGISFGDSITDYDIATIKYSQSVGIEPVSSSIPEGFTLYQNYPNPFNPNTTILFDIVRSGFTELKIYDINGRLVSNPVSEYLSPGKYNIPFNAAGMSSGIYYYRVISGQFTQTKKMILLK